MNETSIRTNNDEATRPPSTLDPFQTAGGSVSIVDGVRDGYNPNHETNHPMTLNLSGHGQIDLRRRVDSAFHLFKRKKLARWGIFAVVSFVVGIVALLVSNRAMNDKTAVDPILAYQERFVNFRTILGNHSEPWTFALPNSPQMKSLQWLVFRDKTLATNPVDEKRLVQRHALMTLFYACNGQNWIGGFATQPPWSDNVAILECGFAGIECDEMGSVVEVQAGQSRWTGYLPDEIGLLTHLKSLQLHVNELQGTLPALAFARLSNLGKFPILESSSCMHNRIFLTRLFARVEELTIDRNDFVSTIPSEIGLMTKLRELHMGRNQLTGSIPSTIKALDLRVLRLQHNDLTGQALEYLASWPNMERLNFDRTWITGTIPESIGKLSNFHTLFLGPYISGTIPNSLANLTNMKFLKMIGDNGSTLGGTIPANFGDLTKLGTGWRFPFPSCGHPFLQRQKCSSNPYVVILFQKA